MTLLKRLNILCVLLSLSMISIAEIPIGYYHLADGKSKAELKTALSSIISQAQMYSYGGGKVNYTWAGFYVTDRDATTNAVIDRYSNEVRYFTDSISSVSGMHIEHSLPKSWWGSIVNNAYCDLHHLFPADGTANSTKNNLPLGTTSEPTFNNGVSKIGPNDYMLDYMGRCFEPADEYKGDFARAYMYVSTAYESFASLWDSPMMNNNTYPVWRPWAISLLLEWHAADPVSQEERERMERVYSIQGNRNPFIDYPELASYIWGSDTLNVFHFPTETSPYLVYPNRWTSVDLGYVLNDVQQSTSINLLGVNLSSDLSISLQNGTKGYSISNTTISSDLAIAGTQIEVSFQSSVTGNFSDTLIVSGGGLSTDVYVPLKVLVTSEFITLEPANVRVASADLNWMKEPSSDSYMLDVYQGTMAAGDLFFSAYVEGSSWNKAIEIYNGTGASVDLSKYSIRKQSNGVGDFTGDTPLSGTLLAGETYVLVHYSAADSLLALADKVVYSSENYSNILSFSGDDAMALYREGVMVDVIGFVNQTTAWGTDVTFARKSTTLNPNVNFDLDEWNTYAKDDISMLGSHSANFDSSVTYILQQYPVGNVNTYHITGLKPSSSYSYRAYACNSSASTVTPSYNAKQVHTSDLLSPLALEATDVDTASFTANWEDDVDVDGFILNVYQLSGTGEISTLEEFSSVGTSGTPLPDGWSGSISGTYTTTTNSGTNTPSVAFKNNGEYLQTQTYSSPLTNANFMYKFVSGGTGSYLLVEGLYGSSWNVVDTIQWKDGTKRYSSYNFLASDNVTAMRFTYTKVKGNVAFDDFSVTYGQYDTIYIVRNQVVNADSYVVTGLNKSTTYTYSVSSYISDVYSPSSNEVVVTTAEESLPTEIVPVEPSSSVNYAVEGRTVILENIESSVSICDVMGRVLFHSPTSNHLEWTASMPGIYILQVGDKNCKLSIK